LTLGNQKTEINLKDNDAVVMQKFLKAVSVEYCVTQTIQPIQAIMPEGTYGKTELIDALNQKPKKVKKYGKSKKKKKNKKR
jgi:hypothetical protein